VPFNPIKILFGRSRPINARCDTSSKTFETLGRPAQLITNIPNWVEQMVRYYGYYSNKMRGIRKKVGEDDNEQALIESILKSREFRKNLARLIRKIYHVNPLLCLKCQGVMKIIYFIEERYVIKVPVKT